MNSTFVLQCLRRLSAKRPSRRDDLAADIVLFDPLRIRDRATFAEPSLPSEGVSYVLVNGIVAFEKGKYTGAKSGVVLRGPGWDGRK